MIDDLGRALDIQWDPTDDSGGSGAFKFDLGSALDGSAPPVAPDGGDGVSSLAAALDSRSGELPLRHATDPLAPAGGVPAAPSGAPAPVASAAVSEALPQRSASAPSAAVPDTLPQRSGSTPQRDMSAVTSAAQALSQRGTPPGAQPTPVPVPEIREQTPPSEPVRAQAAARRSVFDDGSAPTFGGGAPTLAPQPQPQPQPAQVPQPQSSQPTYAPQPTLSAGTSQPLLPSVPAAAPPPAAGASWAPTLPDSIPSAPPMVVDHVSDGPTADDVRALRRAQIRASHQSRGKVVGRTLFAFVSIAALIALALVFGRAYLFPAEWDPALVPIVDEMQAERAIEFDHTVPLVPQVEVDYAATVTSTILGTEWSERMGEWRALGLASGALDEALVTQQIVERWPAVYDPRTDTIYELVDAPSPTELDASLRLALEDAYARQTGAAPAAAADPAPQAAEGDVAAVTQTDTGLVGVSSLDVIARRSADAYLAGTGTAVAADAPIVTQLPLPIAYELAAVDRLGTSALQAAGADVASIALGDEYPDALATVLDDHPVNTAAPTLAPGDTQRSTPTSLGLDDWALVWGARLPRPTVNSLLQSVTADSYVVTIRGRTTCFVGEFSTADEPSGNVVLLGLTEWVGLSPAESTPTVTAVSPTRIRLEACDPGETVAFTPAAASVDDLLLRQEERLLAIVPVLATTPVPDPGTPVDTAAGETATPVVPPAVTAAPLDASSPTTAPSGG